MATTGLTDTLQDQEKQIIGMKVFKKDEPTFETSHMMAEDAWRVYVADFLNSAPTHGTPMLKNATDEEEVSEALKRRVESVSAKEALDFKITVGDYKLTFQTNCDEFWHQPFRVRIGGKGGIAEAEESKGYRETKVGEDWITSNEATKGLSKEDIESKSDAFGKLGRGEGGDQDKMDED